MDIQAEIAYCLRREREERLAAAMAVAGAIRDIHFVMAEHYAERASSLFEARFDAMSEAIIASDAQLPVGRKMIIRSVM